MNENNQKVEVRVANIIGGGCTIGFLSGIIFGIIVSTIPKEFISLFCVLVILGINMIVGIIIRLGRHFEWAENFLPTGSMWGIIFCISATSLLFFINGTKFEMLRMIIFCIVCFISMLKIGFGKLKNIDFRWS